MERLTREKDDYECRVGGGCPAEDWMRSLYGEYPSKDICEFCPFEKYINKLAEIEDKQGEF